MSIRSSYPNYYTCHIKAIGKIPKGWKLLKLKQLVNEERKITYGIVQAGPHVREGVPYIRPVDMTDEKGIKDSSLLQKTSIKIASDYKRSELSTGDLVCSIGPSFGKVMVVPKELNGANLTQGTARISVSYPHNARFVFWALRSPASYQQWESSIGGATFRALNLKPLSETYLPLPSKEEQTQIARFLDYETAKIDALIEKQEQLIALLEEKRQAVISHAVTKGLNPDAPMKDSGIEWLGEIPAHWEVGQLRRWIKEMEQGKSPECENRPAEMNEWGVLKTSCVNRGIYNEQENKALPKSIVPIKRFEVQPGDLLMSRASGSVELIGSVAFVKETRTKILLSDKIFRLHFENNIAKEFFAYMMASTYMRELIIKSISGAEGMANNITKTAIMGFKMALPPKREQLMIANHIRKINKQNSQMVDMAFDLLALLKERRTALISAAVTGKIDVRGWQPPQSEEEEA